MRTLVLLLLLASPLTADTVREVEPNDDPASATQVLVAGQTVEGDVSAGVDVDCFVLEDDSPRILTLRWSLDAGLRFQELAVGRLTPARARVMGEVAVFHRLRVPPGRHVIRMTPGERSESGGYRLSVVAEPDEPGLETELNDDPQDANPLRPGESLDAFISHHLGDVDTFRLEIAERGIYRLAVALDDSPEDPTRLKLQLGSGEDLYHYEVDDLDREFRFFPVLDPGEHTLMVVVRQGEIGAGYRLSLERFDVRVGPEAEAEARKAVDRGVAWLRTASDENDVVRKYGTAVTAVTLLALAEENGEEARVAELVAELAAGERAAVDGEWRGEPVTRFGEDLYDEAFAALALAEALAAGHEEARAPCRAAVRFLLSSQLSEVRCATWEPIGKKSVQWGSWRYLPNAKSGDLSVTGWCLIALYAAAAAGIDEPGMTAAADRALRFLQACGRPGRGFLYQSHTQGTPSNVQNSIGALLSILFGKTGKTYRAATADLDRHLCAGTQTGRGVNSPFYYWYYATRANYLRGGYAWEAWRSVALEQLVRRQDEDGSWAALHHEEPGGRRYATASAVMILRLCLGEPPRYLSGEVEGF